VDFLKGSSLLLGCISRSFMIRARAIALYTLPKLTLTAHVSLINL
jgi:hypothetical protein